MKLRVLVVGGGGREHAIAWKLLQSPLLGELYVAPGNAGTSKIAHNVPIKATDIKGLLDFARCEKIDFVIVGPDEPLALGIADAFRVNDIPIFGPSREAAQIESSKVFAKKFLRLAGVPTTDFSDFTQDEEDRLRNFVSRYFASDPSYPILLKANGLAGGKGAYVCRTSGEANEAIRELFKERRHGKASDLVVVEGYAPGEEVSFHAATDGTFSLLFPPSQDHKRLGDGDIGPNTGGMGAIAPVPWLTDWEDEVRNNIINPIVRGMASLGMKFVGILYPQRKGSNVIEVNARPGDPEMQVYMRLMESDFLGLCWSCVTGQLSGNTLKWSKGYAVDVVLAAGNYPSPDYRKGVPITGIEEAEALSGVRVFHAGTHEERGQLVVSGGRVLHVTAKAKTLEEALKQAYKAISLISFEGMQFRRDIGQRALLLSR